jgi:hypothetical protein
VGSRSLDPLRYGLRALDEMAREQASVTPPPRVVSEVFDPHPVLRRSAPDGAALSLRLFSDAPDDATALVLGEATSMRFEPIPARASALFEAHATFLSTESDDSLTLGFPLVTFVQQGSSRAAPLFSIGGARARWMVGDRGFSIPSAARDGAPMPIPTALVLETDEEATYAVHGGVWYSLFGLDGAALAEIGDASRGGLGALVRAAIRVLESGGEGGRDREDEDATHVSTAPLTRDDLDALGEAAIRRAHASRALRCFPHGLVMLPPRGDPTSGLRADLRAMVDEPVPARGPLAVYLGAQASRPHDGHVWATGRIPPTPSQLAAARAFEGTSDLVAVCGPPGCGKTALLHLVTAQTVVSCALANVWEKSPSRSMAWPLVVTSTNNAAVDQALAPFVDAPDVPLGLRLGSRRTLAETTLNALSVALDALGRRGTLPLADARAAFEKRARPMRKLLREREAQKDARAAEEVKKREIERNVTALRARIALFDGRVAPDVAPDLLDEALRAGREHAEAAVKLVQLHLEGKNASIERACEKWARANELRAPRIEPALRALGLTVPFGALDPARAIEDAERQRSALDATLVKLAEAREILSVPSARAELAAIEAKLAKAPEASFSCEPDPELYEAALLVRDAWAREHKEELAKRLSSAIAAVSGERAPGRGKSLARLLQELAPLFPVAGCTLLSMRTVFPQEKDVIDRLVVDEAAQCAPVYAVPALGRAKRAMLTGDVAQLPPVYTLDPRVDERLAKGMDREAVAPFRMGSDAATSAQAAAEPRARARITLVEHFRSQAPIVHLASRYSGYRLDVRTKPRSLTDVSKRLIAPVMVLPVDGRGERAPEGVVNEAEAAYALDLVTRLVADGVAPSDLAVLTPFVGQCVRIERELFSRGLSHRNGVLVSTVHRLQGGERRIVIFSVTATKTRHLRWLGERPHLLHVATSRAQDHLLVLVDPEAAAREVALSPLDEVLRTPNEAEELRA